MGKSWKEKSNQLTSEKLFLLYRTTNLKEMENKIINNYKNCNNERKSHYVNDYIEFFEWRWNIKISYEKAIKNLNKEKK